MKMVIVDVEDKGLQKLLALKNRLKRACENEEYRHKQMSIQK